MSDIKAPAPRYAAVKRQLQRVADDHQRHLKTAWVDRVLDMLDSDNLIMQAATGQATDSSLLLECNVAALVWDDPRVAYRLRQLEGSGIAVELVDHTFEVAGKDFHRTKMLVTFKA